MVAQWARAMGASRVMLFDLVAEKLELARQLGFSDVYNSREVDPVATVQAATEGQGAHLALDAAGVPPTLLQALEATRRGGRVVLLGNPSGDVTLPVPLISQLLRREIRISGTWNSTYSVHGDDDWRATLEAMSTGAINLRPLVTHRVSLEQSFEALRMMEQGREFFSKVLIHP
jgi:L-iditol 2-dehydrogenase